MRKQYAPVLSASVVWLLVCAAYMFPPSLFAESLCASVKIAIAQDLTLEREGFDASMQIANGFEGIALSNVVITLKFLDGDGALVSATTNASSTNEVFFYRTSSLAGIDSTVDGVIAGEETAEIHWLIIPSSGAGGSNVAGQVYYIGATLAYTVGGEDRTVEVDPDSITVKPMPTLALDYFLPGQVYGDDPDTGQIEEPVPFSLGLRVRNIGCGLARSVKMDSGQPEIVKNELGLLVSFSIQSSEVDGREVSKSLLLNFGDLSPGDSSMGRWIIGASLSGTFRNFEADVSHADELGGRLTSLIQPTNVHTHIHIHDVLVDTTGRDSVCDFLGTNMVLYESEGIDSAVSDVSGFASLAASGLNQYTLSFSVVTQGFIYAKVTNPVSEPLVLKQVERSDGKLIAAANAWISKVKDDERWEYFLNLFDSGASNFSYEVTFQDAAVDNQAPSLAYIGSKIAYVGRAIAFGVCATDEDGVPSLTTGSLPADAVFTDHMDGTGLFSWTPSTNQVGQYQIRFTASDGELSDFETIMLAVKGGNPPGFPSWWVLRGALVTNGPVATNDWAAVNMGQVKHMASVAWDELDALPGGAGFALNFVNTDNYVAVNLGQLKHIATNFYARLSLDYPWIGAPDTNDFAMANIGQVKFLFDFDPSRDSDADGLPDWWEAHFGGTATSMEPDADPDGDGMVNLYEYLHNTIPIP